MLRRNPLSTVKYNQLKNHSPPPYQTIGHPAEAMDPKSTCYIVQMGSVPGHMKHTSDMLIFLHFADYAPETSQDNPGRRSPQQRALINGQRATESARGGDFNQDTEGYSHSFHLAACSAHIPEK
ncbi:hypothetical protein SARC_05912 [Sphaeroforma arctica JP610]|uniref:Uncharacterized protein n=1 Tax=Sphaeroforma arctica JP610 TaxID=667725 RepID=A0A0L0FY77_9EUKA|nr:hypothetical protein SARC_05912 [Sphaeroforma arctica JP610]KNC81790.1 hypothetical protein SARC_05912 [Sphaeroforma arctica JP610]|eukprot:XP_014155692.1 hypothetical protein SARC_05912 [Sphaeroforma arctica JP610]